MTLTMLIFLACNAIVITADADADADANADADTSPVSYNYRQRSSYGPNPTYKHPYCDSSVSPVCVNNSTIYYCLEDPEYPEYEIKGAISADFLFSKKYADVSYEEDNLVEMVTADQEASFDYSFYTGASTGPYPYDATHWAGGEGYICPSTVIHSLPKRAKNVAGKWQVIVNDVYVYSQSVRLEICLFPEAGCRALPPCDQSHCTQKYIYHRLLSLDPCDPYKGLFIDIYKLPSACSCHLPVL